MSPSLICLVQPSFLKPSKRDPVLFNYANVCSMMCTGYMIPDTVVLERQFSKVQTLPQVLPQTKYTLLPHHAMPQIIIGPKVLY